MIRVTATALALLITGGAVFAQATGQTTPPPKPPAPAPQTPAVKPSVPPLPMQEPFPAGATIAYVRIQRLVSDSKFGRCGSVQMKALRDKDAAALAPKQKELSDVTTKIQTQQGVVSDAVMVQLTRDRDRIQREGQALASSFQTDEENKNQDLLNDFQAKIIPLVEVIRKEKSLSFILSADSGAILAGNPALDLTGELVKLLDEAYPDCTKKGGH